MRYKTYTLNELVQIKYGKNQKEVVSNKGDIPIYGTGGLMGYATKYLYNKPSVLIGRKGTIDKVKYVDHPFWTVDTLFYTIVNIDLVIPKYLYYVMSQIDLTLYNEGTTIPSLRVDTLNRLELEIPSVEIQKKILSYLAPIDEKIVLNQLLNKNLEEQVSAIYQSYFGNFKFATEGKNQNWNYQEFSTIAHISSGKRPQLNSKIHNQKTPIPIVGATSVMGFTSEPNYNDKILIIGRVGTHGIVQRITSPCWASDNTLVITSPYYEFVNQILHRIDYSSINRGSTQPLITQKDMKTLLVLVPNEKILMQFEEIASSLMAQCELNKNENLQLSHLRDTLLPKLISGELDVSALDI